MKGLRIGGLVLGYTLLNVLANIGIKLSSTSKGWRDFLLWQIAGNLTGFLGVLTFTALLRLVPLHMAYPVTQGLAMIGVQVIAALLLFREAIEPQQWAGTALVIAGIVLIGMRR